jgi:hypothetical protein
MATTNNTDDTNTLYFIVGGLVVLAVIFGLIYMSNDASIGPSPSSERVVERTSETTTILGDTSAQSSNNASQANEAPASGQSTSAEDQ